MPEANVLTGTATQSRTVASYPYLRRFVLPSGDGRVIVGHGAEIEIQPHWIPLIEAILYDAIDFDELVARATRSTESLDPHELRAKLAGAASAPENVFGIASLPLRPHYDGIMLCQGYGGVYVQALEIWRRLNEEHEVLLIAPVRPPYGSPPELEGKLLTLEDLKETGQVPSYFAYIQVVRALLRNLSYDLLYLEHRSQSIFTFDVLGHARRGTVIHDDGFYDAIFHGAATSGTALTERKRRRILLELYNSLRYNEPRFHGFGCSPLNNRRIMEAGWFALRSVDENWCYAHPPFAMMSDIYRQARGRFAFVPPMVDTSLHREAAEHDPCTILFSTTMHNPERKGIIELCRAMRILPERIRARCVLGQPESMPAYIDPERLRLDVTAAIPKQEFVDLYHRCAVNVRVSRQESSSLAVMESMACGQPIITSPHAARNLPLFEDGVTGFIVSPRDPPRVLADRILRICDDPELRRRMGQACRERVAKYGIDAQLPRLTRYMESSP